VNKMTTKSLAKLEKDYTPIIGLVTDSLTSDHSKVAYKKALVDFMGWYQDQGKPGLNKAIVQRYRTELIASGLSPASVNLRLSAIRKLAAEAVDNGYLNPTVAAGIDRVKGVSQLGVRTGNWLTKSEAQKLLNSPDINTLKGLRDRAILAVMLGGGLRRSEIAMLMIEHIQQRDGRWVIVDLVGKRNHIRSVPIPAWTKKAIDEWLAAADITTGFIFHSIRRGNHLAGNSMTDQAIQDVVKDYAAVCKFNLSAHDLRRTYAKLALKGGAAVNQIQLSLGHQSLVTTEKYLGTSQDLTDAPCDKLGLRLDWN
jgi:site-specific recombinase XerD